MATYDYSAILETLSDQADVEAIIPVYNGGDKEAGFKLVIPLGLIESGGSNTPVIVKGTRTVEQVAESEETKYSFFVCLYNDEFRSKDFLVIQNLKLADSEDGVLIDTNAHLIQGVVINNSGYTTTTNVYNNYIGYGDFFKIIPQTEWLLTEIGSQGIPQLLCIGASSDTNIDYNNVSISYDTLYI